MGACWASEGGRVRKRGHVGAREGVYAMARRSCGKRASERCAAAATEMRVRKSERVHERENQRVHARMRASKVEPQRLPGRTASPARDCDLAQTWRCASRETGGDLRRSAR
eukprot:1963321-Pleurochrysis_carterae.AAC.1